MPEIQHGEKILWPNKKALRKKKNGNELREAQTRAYNMNGGEHRDVEVHMDFSTMSEAGKLCIARKYRA